MLFCIERQTQYMIFTVKVRLVDEVNFFGFFIDPNLHAIQADFRNGQNGFNCEVFRIVTPDDGLIFFSVVNGRPKFVRISRRLKTSESLLSERKKFAFYEFRFSRRRIDQIIFGGLFRFRFGIAIKQDFVMRRNDRDRIKIFRGRQVDFRFLSALQIYSDNVIRSRPIAVGFCRDSIVSDDERIAVIVLLKLDLLRTIGFP